MRDKFIAAVDTERHPDYEAFLQDKVDRARTQIAEDRYDSNEEVDAEFSERRNAVRRMAGAEHRGER